MSEIMTKPMVVSAALERKGSASAQNFADQSVATKLYPLSWAVRELNQRPMD